MKLGMQPQRNLSLLRFQQSERRLSGGLAKQLKDPERLEEPRFASIQTYYREHWDTVFPLDAFAEAGRRAPVPRKP